jgi:hypothetical protein
VARGFTGGSSQYLENTTAPAPFDSTPPTAWSMACWFKPNASTAAAGILTVGDSNANMYGGIIALGATSWALDLNGLGNANGAALVSGTWAHLGGITASATSRTAYKDGVAGTPTAVSATLTGAMDRTNVGAITSTTRQLFLTGDVAECGIWNAALAAKDMVALAAGAPVPLVRPDALVFYAPVYGTMSPEPDVRGGRSLTLGGTPPGTAHPRTLRPDARRGFTLKSVPAVTPIPDVVMAPHIPA